MENREPEQNLETREAEKEKKKPKGGGNRTGRKGRTNSKEKSGSKERTIQSMEKKGSASVMEKAAGFIVDKRKAFYLIFIAAVVYSLINFDRVKINEDITSYLPADTETRQGLTIMEEEFTTFATAGVMVSNLSLKEAQRLSEELGELEGVKSLEFDDTENHYRDSSALFSVTFEGEAEDEVSLTGMNNIKEALKGYDVTVSSEVGRDDSAALAADMNVILVLAAIVIVLVLLFTSRTYLEIPVFIMVFGVAAVLNKGTNFWFGEISFITDSIAIVLQLALAIDYAIILCHRYMEEHEEKESRDAMVAALSKAIPEISSSSLTTISGLVALMLMQLKIGLDMGIVLSKGIVFSLLTVFFLMPGLIMLFAKGIDKTHHKNFVPKITLWGKLVVKLRFVLPVIFVVILVFGIVFSSRCPYVFDVGSIKANKKTESQLAENKIKEIFGTTNVLAVVVPRGDYEKEEKIIDEVLQNDMITSATGLAGVDVNDDYKLTDKLTPRKFSEFTNVDIELVRLLYRAYALDREEYGAAIYDTDSYEVPIVSVFTFLCDQLDKGYLKLDDDLMEQINELRETLDDAFLQLQGENYARIVFNIDGPVESDETFALLDEVRSVVHKYYPDGLVVGNSTSAYDLFSSFQNDNNKISILTVLFVMIILLFTFKSAGIPVLLVLTIQGSIWINFSFPYLSGGNMYFLSYLIVSAIQMGATIDYAIVITNRYMGLKSVMDKKLAVIETLNQSFPTILTSGMILTVAGFLIGGIASDPTIASIGTVLGRGSLISIILVMTVLPQILLLGDVLIEKTALTLTKDRVKQLPNSTIRMDGRFRGRVNGYIDAEIRGIIHGDVSAVLEGTQTVKTDGVRREPPEIQESSDSEKIESGRLESAKIKSEEIQSDTIESQNTDSDKTDSGPISSEETEAEITDTDWTDSEKLELKKSGSGLSKSEERRLTAHADPRIYQKK